MIKNELDLRKLYPETHEADEREVNKTTMEDDDRAPIVKRTLLMRHKARPLQCRNCKIYFIEDQNQDIACLFHPCTGPWLRAVAVPTQRVITEGPCLITSLRPCLPCLPGASDPTGEYKVACPRSCPVLTTKCMSHRMKRWTCCDNRDESKHMQNGCRARRHMAIISTSPYEEIEKAAKAAYDIRDEKLTKELEKITSSDWHREFTDNTKNQIKKMEEDLIRQREMVARFKDIKFE